MSEVLVRPYQVRDIEQVRYICTQTGYKGQAIASSGLFSDLRLFTLLFCDDFLRYQQDTCFVAVNQEDVLGYIIGATDNAQWEKRFVWRFGWRIACRVLGVAWYRYPESVRTLVFFLKHFVTPPQKAELHEQYPAVLHMNVLPGHQGEGIGYQLLARFEKRLTQLGVVGIQLRTTSQNTAAMAFYQRNGYQLFWEAPGPVWPDRTDARHLLYVKKLS